MTIISWMRHRAGPSALTLGPVIILFLITGIVGLTTSVSPYFLISDPSSITDTPFFLGIITRIGVLVWWTTATICLFAFIAAKRIRPQLGQNRFLLWAGLLTAVLALDDMLTLHEKIAPVYLGVSEKTVYAVYGAWAAVMFFHFRHSVARSDYYFLLVALFFFASSQFVDMARSGGLAFYGVGFIEEGCKMMGIAAWLGYFACFSAQHLKEAAAPSESEPQAAMSHRNEPLQTHFGAARVRK